MANDYDNHERIWLEPVEPVDPIEGRQWCRDNVWGNGVEYIRTDLVPAPENHLQAIARAAQVYVESVDGMPEKDCWDTEDGKEAPGALRFASDLAWQEYDVKKQKAFDDLRAALDTTEDQP